MSPFSKFLFRIRELPTMMVLFKIVFLFLSALYIYEVESSLSSFTPIVDEWKDNVKPEDIEEVRWFWHPKTPKKFLVINRNTASSAYFDGTTQRCIGCRQRRADLVYDYEVDAFCMNAIKLYRESYDKFVERVRTYNHTLVPEICWNYLDISTLPCPYKKVTNHPHGLQHPASSYPPDWPSIPTPEWPTPPSGGGQHGAPQGGGQQWVPPPPPGSTYPPDWPSIPTPEWPTPPSGGGKPWAPAPASTYPPNRPARPTTEWTTLPPFSEWPDMLEEDGDCLAPPDDDITAPPEWPPEWPPAEHPKGQEPEDPREGCLDWLLKICASFKAVIKAVKGLVIDLLKKIFTCIFWVLSKIAQMFTLKAVLAWRVFTRGLRCLCNIFQAIFNFFKGFLGRVLKCIAKGIRLGLNLIIGARDGACAFAEVLKPFSEKENLMETFESTFEQPKTLCDMISGLGGKISMGVTGVFTILSKIFSFTVENILGILKKFADNVLDCVRGERPSTESLNIAARSLGAISREQISRYHNAAKFRTFDDMVGTLRGESRFTVKGLPASKILDAMKDAHKSAKQSLMGILSVLNPFAPMKSLVAQLFVETITSINTTDGHVYVKQLFPDIDIPEIKGQTGVEKRLDMLRSAHISVLNLNTPDMLRSIPLVKDIYEGFDDIALEYTNTTLEYLITHRHVKTLVEFTTTAMGLRDN